MTKYTQERSASLAPQRCPICNHTGTPAETQRVRCNVRRFRDRTFIIWRCERCQSLNCENISNIEIYYENYPIRNQNLDYFTRAWYRVILKRLVDAGLRKEHSVLDFGCNRGLFLEFLRENDFTKVVGYDLYVKQFNSENVLNGKYDFVVSLDVIEHDHDPHALFVRLVQMLKPHGRLCLETPNAAGIDLTDTDEYLHALHVPYHLHILSQQALANFGEYQGLDQVATYNRWYMDSWRPGTARRLFESLLKFGDNDLDTGYEPPRLALFFSHPVLFIYLLIGYFLPMHKSDHMMMIFARSD